MKKAGIVPRISCPLKTKLGTSRHRRQQIIAGQRYMQKIATISDVNYYLASYPGLDIDDLPWGDETFDCFIFPPTDESGNLMDSLLAYLPYESMDWVHVAEPDFQYWHDRIDSASVSAGVQKKVGDGKPMTAWFEELKCLEDFATSYNHGGQTHCLIIVVGNNPFSESTIRTLRNKLNDV